MDPVPPIIRQYIDAYNAMDVEAMLVCLSDDVQFTNRADGIVTHHTSGLDAFRSLAEQAVQMFVKREQMIVDCIAIEDRAALRVGYRAVVKIDLPNGWKAGQEIQMNGTAFFAIANEKITEVVDAS